MNVDEIRVLGVSIHSQMSVVLPVPLSISFKVGERQWSKEPMP
jgi:hypothetical protein